MKGYAIFTTKTGRVVSIDGDNNYKLHPNKTMKEVRADIASALSLTLTSEYTITTIHRKPICYIITSNSRSLPGVIEIGVNSLANLTAIWLESHAEEVSYDSWTLNI